VLLLVLAVVWVAILLPISVRYWRDRGGERKIDSFHTEREILIRQEHEHVVAPEPRYESASAVPLSRERSGRPHLTVVYPEDTVRSLQERGTWDDWRRDYEYEVKDNRDAVRARLERNRYAAAYASVPSEDFYSRHDEPYGSLVAMQVRRRRILVTLALTCLAFTAFTFVSSSLLLENLAVLAWAALIGFVDIGLVAIGLGYMQAPFSASYRFEEVIATSAPSRRVRDREVVEEEYFDESDESAWRRESAPRRALG